MKSNSSAVPDSPNMMKQGSTASRPSLTKGSFHPGKPKKVASKGKTYLDLCSFI